jgi:hypothetical protein
MQSAMEQGRDGMHTSSLAQRLLQAPTLWSAIEGVCWTSAEAGISQAQGQLTIDVRPPTYKAFEPCYILRTSTAILDMVLF